MFDRFFDEHVSFIKGLLLAAAIMLALFSFLLARYPAFKQYEKTINRSFVIAALLSSMAFFNMGFMHYKGGFFHGFDLYNNYMAAKYFNQVGYKYLPQATLVADSEDKNFLLSVSQYRDFDDYNIKDRGLINSAEIKSRFDEKQWREFKEDLWLFQFKEGMKDSKGKPLNLGWWSWGNIVTESNYNCSPPWVGISNIVTNIMPVTNMPALRMISLSDLLLIAAMGWIIFKSFNIRSACLFITMLTCCYTNYFSWVGASLYRLDWLALCVFGICFAKQERFVASGVSLAAAALFKPFTLFLTLGFLVKAGWNFYENKKADQRMWKFLGGFFLSAAVLILLSLLILKNPIIAWQDYFARASYLANQWDSWQWGFKDIFIWQGEMGQSLPGMWQKAKLARFESLAPVILIIQVFAAIALVYSCKHLAYWEAATLGSFLIFLTLYISNIYYIFPAMLVLFYSGNIEKTWRFISLCCLFFMMILMRWLSSFASYELMLKFYYAIMLTGIMAYTFYELIEENKRRED